MAGDRDYLKLGLTGWPLRKSISPLVHQRFLESSDIAGEYVLYPVEPSDFYCEVESLFREGLKGLNVTYPHKMVAPRLCRRLVGAADELQVVNTLDNQNGIITGYNTDITGFMRFMEVEKPAEPFFIVGSGGVALAVSFALESLGLASSVFSRNPETWAGKCNVRDLDEICSQLERIDSASVINATTLGWDDDDSFPVHRQLLVGSCFIDLNYNMSWEWRNSLLTEGTRVITGESMLVYQAAESFEIWTGLKPDAEDALKWAREAIRSDRRNS